MINGKSPKLANTSIFLLGIIVIASTWFLGGNNYEAWLAKTFSTALVLGLWLIWLGACFGRLFYSQIPLSILRPIIVVFCVLLVGLTLDNGKIKLLLYPVNLVIAWLADFLGSYRKYIPSAGKIGHILVFFALTLILLRLRKLLDVSGTGIILFAILVALATESLQLYVPTRTTAMKDLIYDCFGIALAVVWYTKGKLLALSSNKS